MPLLTITPPYATHDHAENQRSWAYMRAQRDFFRYSFDAVTFEGDLYIFPDPLIVDFTIIPDPDTLHIRVTGKALPKPKSYYYGVDSLETVDSELLAVPAMIYRHLVKEGIIEDTHYNTKMQHTMSREAFDRMSRILDDMRAGRRQ